MCQCIRRVQGEGAGCAGCSGGLPGGVRGRQRVFGVLTGCKGFSGVVKGVLKGGQGCQGVFKSKPRGLADLESGGDVKVLLHVGAQNLADGGGPRLALGLEGSRVQRTLHTTLGLYT